ASVLLHAPSRARYDDLRRQAKHGRLRYPCSPHVRSDYGARPKERARTAAYRARGARPHRWRTPVRVAPVAPLADAFLRRLVGAAALATLLVACITEHSRPLSRRAHQRALEPIVYAADYPPCPVRYATLATHSVEK